MSNEEIIKRIDEAMEKLGGAPEIDPGIIKVSDITSVNECVADAYNMLDRLAGILSGKIN